MFFPSISSNLGRAIKWNELNEIGMKLGTLFYDLSMYLDSIVDYTVSITRSCLEKLATCPATRDKLYVHMVGRVSKPMIGRISLSRNRVTNPTPILVWRIGWSSHVPVRDLVCPMWLLYWIASIPSRIL